MPADQPHSTRLPFPADVVRASDAEREEVAEILRAHAEAGRIEPEEHAERLDRVYAARLRSDLAEPVADLPQLAAGRPQPAPSPAVPAVLRSCLAGYLAVAAILVAVWAATGAEEFWPIWFLGFGALAVAKRTTGHGSCGRARHARRTQSA